MVGDACSTVGRGLSPATLKCRKPVKLCGAAYAGVAAHTIDELGDLGMDKVRWGFLGAGSIANRLGEGLMQVDDAELLAVGSRTADRRQALAERFGVPRQYATYEELVQDPDIDVVYIATPHNLHREHSILALEAGKPVLCEKPFAINVAEAADIIAVARQRNLFLMEAMWTRYLPVPRAIKGMIDDGVIGQLTMMVGDFGFRGARSARSRLTEPALGGGALLDIGIYPVSFAAYLFGGLPTRIETLGHLEGGIDERSGILLGYPDGGLAICYSSIRDNTPQECLLFGSGGEIRMPTPWWLTDHFHLKVDGEDWRRVEAGLIGKGFAHEVMEVNRCLKAGLLESPDMTWSHTMGVMTTLDTIRAQWGLRYPME